MPQPEILFLMPYFYLYGSIPYAFIFTYLFKREIIFEKGSRNVGVANTFGIGGILPGFLTVFGEISKAVFPLLIAYFFFSTDLPSALILIFASLVGTNFSIFLGARGGMGSTIIIWSYVLLVIFDYRSIFILLAMGPVFFITYFISKNTTLTNRIAYGSMPLLAFAITQNYYFTGFALLVAIIYNLRYRPEKDEAVVFKVDKRGFRQFFKKWKYVENITKRSNSKIIGKKAEGLRYLLKNDYKIPKTLVVNYIAFEEYHNNNDGILQEVAKELEEIIDFDHCFSIRSSASVEDSIEHSFAGQFESYLNITAMEEILEKIELIWKSVESEMVSAYTNGVSRNNENFDMAVIIQEMIQPKLSGVIFTKNPLTGLDEIVVEAIEGLGERIIKEGENPERWVYKWGNWLEKPENSEKYLPLVKELIKSAQTIEKKYGKPLDLEWAFDGDTLYWLQMRDITTLTQTKLYSNRQSKEFLPGIIKPLIWSINIPVVNTSWRDLFKELIGGSANKIDVNCLAKSFYYRAYFNMGVIGDIFEVLGMPRELLEILAGLETPGPDRPKFTPTKRTFLYIPRIIIFAIRKAFYSFNIRRFLRRYQKKFLKIASKDISQLSSEETIKTINELFELNSKASYVVIVSQLLNSFYNMLLKRKAKKKGIDMMEIPLSNIYQKMDDIDPRTQLSKLNKEYNKLTTIEKKKLHEITNFEHLNQLEIDNNFKTILNDFLSNFGYLRDSGNDFSEPTWRETPSIVISMIENYTSKNGHNLENNTTIPKNFTRKRYYKRAEKFLIFRERVNYLYQFGYGLFRPFFLRLADILLKKGKINNIEDIFYLTTEEIELLFNENGKNFSVYELIEQRKQEIERYRDIKLPELIYDDKAPEPLPKDIQIEELSGVATSKGEYTGKIKVVLGRKDLTKILEGDIIVIPYSDISWTPLFAKAKAVISESGGILSHCSIVAREYKIPAVVSVENATSLKDNTLVKVDGYTGKIAIIKEENKK